MTDYDNVNGNKLHIGGDQILTGWQNLMLQDIGSSKLLLEKISGYSNEQFEMIRVERALSFFSQKELPDFFSQLYRITKKTGELHISVPDSAQLFRLFLEQESDHQKQIETLERIYGSDSYANRCGFTPELLMEYLGAAGFTHTVRADSSDSDSTRSAVPLIAFRVYKTNPVELHVQNFVQWFSDGSEAFTLGDYARAYESFDKARKIQGSNSSLLYNLALAAGKLGRIEESVALLNDVLALDPHYLDAESLRDSIWSEYASRFPSTITAETGDGNFRDTLIRAITLQNQGKADDARFLFEKLLTDDPNSLQVHHAKGVLEASQNNHDSAMHHFKRVVEIDPQYANGWYNLAIVNQTIKQLDQALECYNRAYDIDPTNTSVLINRGVVFAALKRHKDALMCFEELLAINPDNPSVLANRAVILGDFKMYDMAIQSYKRLLTIKPEYDFGWGMLTFEKLYACEWSDLDTLLATIVSGIRQGKKVCNPLAFTAMSGEPEDHYRCARIFADSYYPAQKPLWNGEIYRHDKIRIAYVSPDFREHPVAHLTAGMFENHDRSRFELTAFSMGPDDESSLRQRIESTFDSFVDIRQMATETVAQLIRSLEIDILIDLAGYTADSRTDIFAFKPAPVQVNFLGYSNTMGAEYYDYLIGDRYIIPRDTYQWFSEKIVTMPDTYLPTDTSLQFADITPSRSMYNLPDQGFVFCCFNHDYKISPAVFSVWMRLLSAIPESVIWLMKLNEHAEKNLLREAEQHGVDPKRIVFATRVPRIEDHLARYRCADLYLDTSPCNGHSTTSDVLRAGLPVVTCRGKTFAGRVASALLEVVGLSELITDSLDRYEALALELAQNRDRLNSVKEKLERNLIQHNPFDTQRFCRNLEQAFETMHQRVLDGLLPDHFTVE